MTCTVLVIGKLLRNTGKGQALSMVDHVFSILSCGQCGPCSFFHHLVVVFCCFGGVLLAIEDQSFFVLLFLCLAGSDGPHSLFYASWRLYIVDHTLTFCVCLAGYGGPALCDGREFGRKQQSGTD